MGVIMSYILRKWRGDMTATEENLLGFLREFPEFGKCVKFLEEYIKGTDVCKEVSLMQIC